MGNRRKGSGSRGGVAGFETYDERMDEITRWNIKHTDRLEVFRGQIKEERLISWSEALRSGIRKVLKGSGYGPWNREYEALRDLYQFITKQRITLLGNPTMREAKGIGEMDPLSVCILCGIKASKQERGIPGMMNTIKLKLLERYLG